MINATEGEMYQSNSTQSQREDKKASVVRNASDLIHGSLRYLQKYRFFSFSFLFGGTSFHFSNSNKIKSCRYEISGGKIFENVFALNHRCYIIINLKIYTLFEIMLI